MADFDSTTWDVAKEADKLHQSLFGNYKKAKGLMKRKEREDSLDISHHRTYKKQKSELYGIHATSNEKVQKEIQNTETVEQRSNKQNSNDVSENILNRKIKKTKVKAVNDSLHRSAVNETNSMEDSSQDMKKKVRKKKKRKRKYKKNKFKDYSKPDSVPAEENIVHESSQPLPISSSHQEKGEKFKSNEVSSGNENTKSEKQKKTKKHKLKRDKQNSFDSNLMTDIRKEQPMNIEQSHKQIKPFETSSSKHHRNKFDPQKLQAILQAGDTLKAQAGTSDKVSALKEQGANEKIKRPAEDVHEAPGSLIEKSRKRLNAARFRYLNEQLYTRTGSEAFQMFSEDKEAFQVYHEGFQGQVDKWPVNPVDLMIDFIKSKPKHLVVADFGCGDAKLAQNVPNKVHSFDLVALNNHVTVCDMAKVPLKDTSIDIAVFCLSLMGTNLSSYLSEANRVLRKGGLLKIAEVTSRFHSIGQFILKVEKMGFKVTNQDNTNKMFVMMDFRKTGPPKPSPAQIKLDPCVYKKR